MIDLKKAISGALLISLVVLMAGTATAQTDKKRDAAFDAASKKRDAATDREYIETLKRALESQEGDLKNLRTHLRRCTETNADEKERLDELQVRNGNLQMMLESPRTREWFNKDGSAKEQKIRQ